MPLNIKNEETHDLARQLAAQTGESLSRAVHHALEEKLQRMALAKNPGGLRARVEEIVKRAAARPILDHRTPDEIIGYDENGLPQ